MKDGGAYSDRMRSKSPLSKRGDKFFAHLDLGRLAGDAALGEGGLMSSASNGSSSSRRTRTTYVLRHLDGNS